VRERFDQPEHLLSLAAGRNAIREVVEEALKKPSRRRRSRVMRYLQGSSSLADEPADSPADEAEDSRREGYAGAGTSSVEEQAAAGPATPIDAEEIDVSDWEVASPDV
jgi:hypothetical protein